MLTITVYYKSGSATLYAVVQEEGYPNEENEYVAWLERTSRLGFIRVDELTSIPLHRVDAIHWRGAH